MKKANLHAKKHMRMFCTSLPIIRSSNTHYKVFEHSCRQSASETEQQKMEAAKQFNDLTWADLTIIDDELKTVWEFDVKSLKYRDLWIVISQLKVKGVKNSTTEQTIKKLVSLHQFKARYNKILETPDPAPTSKEAQCPYRLLNILFSDEFAEGFSQLGNVAAHAELNSGKAANNQLFGKVSKKISKGKTRYTTI